MSETDQIKSLARQLLEDDISRGDEAVAARIIHPDFVDHTNPPGMQHGLAGHKAIVSLFRTAFPDQWWQIEDLIAEGDKIVARTTMTGTHQGDFFGISATGRSVTLKGIHIMRVADGRVIEHWGSNDDLGMMRQLGVIPEPSAPA
jgi:predicted ester cyclase